MASLARWVFGAATLLLYLALLHACLFQKWYLEYRKSFMKKENVHLKDISLAIQLAAERGPLPTAAPNRTGTLGRGEPVSKVALLFMVRDRLEQVEVWRTWLQEARPEERERISIYFHLADLRHDHNAEIKPTEEVTQLRSLPGFRQIVPTVATGWCELMAAQVQLAKTALADDPNLQLLVYLPHDSTPLAPLGATLETLLEAREGLPSRAPATRFCPAGVRGIDVSYECPHAVEPHWNRALFLKHHQWMALSRVHAERLTDARALRLAAAVFRHHYLSEPMCSDEVLPILTFGVPDDMLDHVDDLIDRAHPGMLPLVAEGAYLNIESYSSVLKSQGILEECLLYAPWKGCHLKDGSLHNKRAKSPVLATNMSDQERQHLMSDLLTSGVLFARKLGASEDPSSAATTLAARRSENLGRVVQELGHIPQAPRRLWPTSDSPSLVTQIRWGLAPPYRGLPLYLLVVALLGWVLVKVQGMPKIWFQGVTAIYLAIHLVVFFCSIALCDEYTFWEPLYHLRGLKPLEL